MKPVGSAGLDIPSGTFVFGQVIGPYAPTLAEITAINESKPWGRVESSDDVFAAPVTRDVTPAITWPAEATYQFTVSELRCSPTFPMFLTYGADGPRKRRGLTGKAYRAERRRWARVRRQERRQGW